MPVLNTFARWFKFGTPCFAFCLAGCSLNPTQSAPTPEAVLVEVTRFVQITSAPNEVMVTVEVPIVVTAIPTPYLNKDCFDKALTQMELDECAIGRRELAEAQLAETVVAIKLSPSDQELFDQMQAEWRTRIEQDCRFMFGRVLKSEDGGLYYEHGSMGPMNYAICVASNIEQRNKELRFAYYLEH